MELKMTKEELIKYLKTLDDNTNVIIQTKKKNMKDSTLIK